MTLIIFGIGILFPEINARLHLIKEEAGNENRTKAQMPAWNISNLDEWVRKFDAFYTDNFSLRQNLISIHNNFEFTLFKISPIPNDVIVGKEGWFYGKNCQTNYKGINLFTKDELVKLRNELLSRTMWAQKHGIQYYLAVIPDKMDVYPEYLPANIVKVSPIGRYDQVAELERDSLLKVIDLRKNILAHKKDGYFLYQHTDDHWNELGAYYGYQTLIERIGRDFSAIQASSIHNYRIDIEKRTGNMAKMMNVENEYPEEFVRLTPKNGLFAKDGPKAEYKVPEGIANWDYEIVKENDHGKEIKCLVIRDSYALQMLQYLQEHFRKTVLIHGQWKGIIDKEIILREKPDIIINMMVETYLDELLQNSFDTSSGDEIMVQLKASNGKFISPGPDLILRAESDTPTVTCEYTLVRLEDSKYALISSDRHYLSAELAHTNEIIANREKRSDWEEFEMVKISEGRIAFKAVNGKFLVLDPTSRQIFAKSDSISTNELFNIILK